MRKALARAAVVKLEPDLVILDEFQRFKDLMSEESEGADLARALFDYPQLPAAPAERDAVQDVHPPDEPEGDDHYKDFIDTVKFLAGPPRAASVQASLGDLGRPVRRRAGAARSARDDVQSELRRVMSRTERLATTPDRDGLVCER